MDDNGTTEEITIKFFGPVRLSEDCKLMLDAFCQIAMREVDPDRGHPGYQVSYRLNRD